ncbi:glycosyltransferase family 2 protein [Echinicola jeungdonensis]|uniref:Glycosyltransferase family 2 protein n=1 Tax=Echinicola jeungdonensis TaxID=709343 RepID=A0ABV5J2R4_9BACT|nr:glycosyltransferase family 2 protein [Echinicola jeungdonensis]MDN3668117.1 glycosyltransferase family 2 protein [Echinicola jeungdonensis]
MNLNPLVSIITVTYNSEKFIQDTFRSIENQTYKNFEYLVIDGKSKDNTLKLALEFKERLSQEMNILSEKDEGIYDAMNKGIRLAKGELICILNSDDFLEPTALEKYVETYNLNDQSDNLIIVGDANMVSEVGELRYNRVNNNDILNNQIEFTMPLVHPAFCVHRNLYNNLIGLFDTSVKLIADYDFTYKAFKSGKVEFRFTETVSVNMREGGVSDIFDLGLIWDRAISRYRVRKGYQSFLKNSALCFKFFSEEVIRQFLKKYFAKSKLLKTNRK